MEETYTEVFDESTYEEPVADLSVYDDFYRALNHFYELDYPTYFNRLYHHYVVDTVSGGIQLYQSFSYGEMVISFLLLCILLVMCFKWFWEVLR